MAGLGCVQGAAGADAALWLSLRMLCLEVADNLSYAPNASVGLCTLASWTPALLTPKDGNAAIQ